MSKTIVFRSDRTPQPGRVHVGFETDNMVERLAFVLPQLDAQQTAMLMLGGTYVNMVQLSEGGGVYYVDMTAELIGKAGEAEGYVVVNTPDGRVWNSAPFVLVTGDLPDIDGELQEHFPDAIQQMRQEIAEHNAEMAEQAEAAHAAVNAAEAAAKRSETAAESFVEQDPTVPEWAKQPSKPVYSSEEVGAPSKAAFEALAAEVGKKQPAGDYASKDDIPTVPTKLSAFENDVGYAANLATWAKQPNKPTYTPAEVGAPSKQELNVLAAKVDNKQPKGDYALKSELPNVTGYATEAWVGTQLAGYQPKGDYQPAGDYALKSELPSVPTKLSELAQDATHRLTTDAEKAAWNAKVKTVNGTAPDANGNVQIEADGGGVTSWNDLEDRPFRDIEITYLDNATVQCSDGNSYNFDASEIPTVGSTMTVIFDGKRYDVEVYDFVGSAVAGDLGILMETPAGDPPFLVCVGDMDGGIGGLIKCSEPSVTHTVTIIGRLVVKIPKVYYSRHTKFYMSQTGDAMEYLCHDVLGDKRITKQELSLAVETGPIMVSHGDTYYYIPIYINTVTDECGLVVCMEPDGNLIRCVTAEYTPTT